MTVRCVNNYSIDTSIYESMGALHGVVCDTHSSSHPQTAMLVLRRVRPRLNLYDVLLCYKPDKMVLLVNDRKLLYLVLLKNVGSSGEIRELRGGYQILFRHDF